MGEYLTFFAMLKYIYRALIYHILTFNIDFFEILTFDIIFEIWTLTLGIFEILTN